jgi:hypothetical protein
VTFLLDANALIALLVSSHVHHEAAESWLVAADDNFATCPITQGSLTRFLVREGQSAEAARTTLTAIINDLRHEFWPDSLSYTQVPTTGITGHRQITDAYLAQLARSRNARLATFDQALSKLHSDVAELILGTSPS